jgi:hypothetical protein
MMVIVNNRLQVNNYRFLYIYIYIVMHIQTSLNESTHHSFLKDTPRKKNRIQTFFYNLFKLNI